MYRKVLLLCELEDIVNDPTFMTSNDVDIVVLPPDPDELTDEDDVDDNNLGTVEVSDVPGELILQYKLPKNGTGFYLLGVAMAMAMVNSWLVYKLVNENDMSLLEYR
ncbi:hypothetical protein ILUMI_22500 [Ignelater luminosus]|uniref:Uncharacterized protein n=1 Tax=Ignelater luminosus TaxID=2038154 RepID=A0A8K0CA24_IGNLU|nr:hypothetical protein ILUMI_22500 [Ignelater luminosus]